MNNPSVSIIVPVYNAASYIRRCLDSIRVQTLQEWETILVDDGSTDASGEICDSYCNVDPRFRVIHKENGGVSSARECGLQHSKGEYLIHVDPDDYVENTMLEELFGKAKEEDADMVICDMIEEWSWGTLYQKQEPSSLLAERIILDFFSRIHGSCCNKLVRRSCFVDFDVHFPLGMNYCEDEYVNISLLQKGIRVTYLEKAFYHYDHTSNPTSLVNSSRKSFERTITRIEGLAGLFGDDHQDILDRLKLTAKQRCIETWQPYFKFMGLYPEISSRLMMIEDTFSSGHVVSIASRCRIIYHSLCLWAWFKDCVFVLRSRFRSRR